MRNFKKIIAVAITIVMLLSVAAIGVSAETAATLSLYGKSTTGLTKGEGYYELDVYLTDAEEAVGGIEGVITYDKDVFTYNSVVLSDTFAANNTVDNSIAHTDGTIKFVGLATGSGVWFTVRFEVIAAGTADFTLTAKGALADGSDYIKVTVEDAEDVVSSSSDIINVMGAAIKRVDKTDAQDLKFDIQVDEEALATLLTEKNTTVKESGILLMFTRRLGYGELTVDLPENTVGLVRAAKYTDGVTDFTANINGLASNQIGASISARAYIILENNEVIYSQNYSKSKETVSGYGSESVLGVALEAAADCVCDDAAKVAAVQTIIDNANAGKGIPAQDRVTLLSYIADYYPDAE